MEEDQKKKLTIMRIGVVLLVAIILGLWFLNLRGALRDSREKLASSDTSQWQDMKDELNQTLTEVKDRLGELNKLEKPPVDTDAADKLLDDLIEETEKIASSSIDLPFFSTSTPPATGTSPLVNPLDIKNTNCPVYINCMPTIGEARPCQIPAGCEGITQIAY
ncbi:MAG: hypothetical protein WC905_01865 [Patescibacteria group bacterium]|jgi:hypothetical protein